MVLAGNSNRQSVVLAGGPPQTSTLEIKYKGHSSGEIACNL